MESAIVGSARGEMSAEATDQNKGLPDTADRTPRRYPGVSDFRNPGRVAIFGAVRSHILPAGDAGLPPYPYGGVMADHEPSSHEMRTRMGLGAGLAVGMGAGVAFGVSLDNWAVGIGIGLAIGIALSVAFSRAPRPAAPEESAESDGAGAGDDIGGPDAPGRDDPTSDGPRSV